MRKRRWCVGEVTGTRPSAPLDTVSEDEYGIPSIEARQRIRYIPLAVFRRSMLSERSRYCLRGEALMLGTD
jgi:hypothetical protein